MEQSWPGRTEQGQTVIAFPTLIQDRKANDCNQACTFPCHVLYVAGLYLTYLTIVLAELRACNTC